MEVTPQALRSIYIGLSTAYTAQFAATQTQWQRVAMEVTSTGSANEYPRLDDIPAIREWIGDRVEHDVGVNTFRIENRTFENTLVVQREKIEDDQIGIYTPLAAMLGQQVAEFPDSLIWPLLKRGSTSFGPDGQYFFDTDHASFSESGAVISASNFQAGSGPSWYLVDTSQVVKPLIYQPRRAFKFVSLDRDTDERVFSRRKFTYGIDGRCNAGFGMWQLAFCSQAELTAENYSAARTAMRSRRKRDGSPLVVRPNLLIVPPALEAAGRRILVNEKNAAGADNEWVRSAELLVADWLM
ncbi:Mu-like prophage major head subunit gpT family protein [Segnochrobactrum spirostomi]|uniref:Bacteriophage Mu GpT domain-containing protein n=1 Tax=Segnochrobactrum spirostomi TaxID=2608987 RepID=A0A6A7Y5C0_9HYPH|nr:Mu-like prophage major head subunit gpT family protein [Segnochrobactrum spirostomi]MQT14393.1 hypothetical protein [Segnochrobactrum spirostomi]